MILTVTISFRKEIRLKLNFLLFTVGHLDNGQVKLKEGKHARAKDANIVHQDPNLICIFDGDGVMV